MNALNDGPEAAATNSAPEGDPLVKLCHSASGRRQPRQ